MNAHVLLSIELYIQKKSRRRKFKNSSFGGQLLPRLIVRFNARKLQLGREARISGGLGIMFDQPRMLVSVDYKGRRLY